MYILEVYSRANDVVFTGTFANADACEEYVLAEQSAERFKNLKARWWPVNPPRTPAQEAEDIAQRPFRIAKKVLEDTNHHVFALVELGTPIPDQVKTQRAAARAKLASR